MGKIKKILENELVGGTQSTDVYPVTSVKAVYDENNERLDHILARKGVVNVSTNYNDDHIAEVLTLEQAIVKVPSSDRTLGFVMTFLTSDGWKTYQFNGDSISEWTDVDSWKYILDSDDKSDYSTNLTKLNQIVNLIGGDDIQYPEMNIAGYYRKSDGQLSTETGKSANVPVVAGDEYLVFTRINKNVTFVDIEGINITKNTSATESGSTTTGKWYKIIPNSSLLGVTVLSKDNVYDDIIVTVVHIDPSKESAYRQIMDLWEKTSSNEEYIKLNEESITSLENVVGESQVGIAEFPSSSDRPLSADTGIQVRAGLTYYVRVAEDSKDSGTNFWTTDDDQVTPSKNKWTKFIPDKDGTVKSYTTSTSITEVKFECISGIFIDKEQLAVNTEQLAVNTEQILGVNNPNIKINFNLTGYFNNSGKLSTEGNAKSAIVDVDPGEKYYLFTYANNNISIVDVEDESADTYSVNTSHSGSSFSWQLTLFTPKYDKVGITCWNIDSDYKPFLIKGKGSLIDTYSKVKTLNDTIYGAESSIPLQRVGGYYYSEVGNTIANGSFSVFIAEVEAGKEYTIVSRLNQDSSVVALDSDTFGEGNFPVLAVGTGSNMNNQAVNIIATTNFIGISTQNTAISQGLPAIYEYGGFLKTYSTNEDTISGLAKGIGFGSTFEAFTQGDAYPQGIKYDGAFVYEGMVYKARLISGNGGNLYLTGTSLISVLSNKWQYFTANATGTLSTYAQSETHNIIEVVAVGSIYEDSKGGRNTRRLFFENAGATKIELAFSPAYYDGSGTLSNDNPYIFKHANIEVEAGQYYAILTRISSNMVFMNLNQLEDVEYGTVAGTIIARGWNTGMGTANSPEWQLRIIKAPSQYLGISLWKESPLDTSEEDAFCYKINGGWFYDLVTGSNFQGVSTEDLKGILPQSLTSYGSYYAADGYITTQGICTNYNTKMAENCLLKSVHFYTNKAGKIRFGVGTIDQRNWAIIQQEFEVDCVAGENTIDILDLGIVSPRGGYLFAYNNYYGDGCSIGYKLVDSTYSYYFYSDDTLSALHKLDSSIASTGAHLCLQYQLATDKLMYARRQDYEFTDYWAEAALTKAAYNIGYNNLIKGDDGFLYKMVVKGGALSVEKLTFNKITIFGNSIWQHGALATGWLSPITDDQGTWSYYEPEDGGMSGMSGRGMAATQQEFDFKHLFLRGMQVSNPDVIVQGANIAGIERSLPKSFGYESLLTEDVDVIFWRAGENVGTVDENYKNALRRYIEYFQERCPNALIILTGRFWKQEASDKIVNEVAEEYRLPFIKMYMSEAKYQASGAAILSYPVKLDTGDDIKTVYAPIGSGGGHPSNLGMYKIANLMLKSLGQKPLNLLHKVTITNAANVAYTADDEQIEGAIYTIRFSSTPPNVTVKNSNDSSTIDTHILGNAVYFFMPDADVTIELSA